MKLGTKQIIILVSVAVLVIGLILYFTYRAGKRKGGVTSAPPPDDIVGASLTEDRKNFLNGLAQSLHYDMSGVNMWWENALYEETSLLGNNELVALSNIFNHKYQADSGETFLQWLQGENFAWDDFSLSTSVDTIKTRLISLGVS